MKMQEKFAKRLKHVKGSAVGFAVDRIILPSGEKAVREYMLHPGAVAVVPFVDKNTILLVKQYRYPVKKVTYEIPAGKLDKGENPANCVRRELEEETGYAAGRAKRICSFWPTPAFSDEIIHIYIADKLKTGKMSPDSDEFISPLKVKFKQALSWVKNGKIRDSKTVIALLMCELLR